MATSNEQKEFLIGALSKNNTVKETKLLYKGSKDGFKAVDFHSKCDH